MFDANVLSGEVEQATIEQYNMALGLYRKYCEQNDICPLDAKNFYKWRSVLVEETELSPASINNRVAAIKSIHQAAYLTGHITIEQAMAFRMVKKVRVRPLRHRVSTTRRTHISKEDMKRLCDAPRKIEHKAILHTLASTGLRASELCNLKIADIEEHEDGYTLWTFGKTDKEPRRAYISAKAYQYIKEAIESRDFESEYVFPSKYGERKGSRLTRQALNFIVKKYADAMGMENVKPHDFRRFVATQISAINPIFSRQVLGHVDISTTIDSYITEPPPVGITDDLI